MKNFHVNKDHVETSHEKLDKNFDVWKKHSKESKIRRTKKKGELSFKKVNELTKGHAEMAPEI